MVLLTLVALFAACTTDPAPPTTTSSIGTTDPVDGATTTLPGDTSTTSAPAHSIDRFRQAFREDTDNGVVVHLVIVRTGYTEIDLERFVREFRGATPGLWRLELFDDDRAQEAFMVPAGSRTDEQAALISRYHLLTLAQGDTLIWRGPLGSLGQKILD